MKAALAGRDLAGDGVDIGFGFGKPGRLRRDLPVPEPIAASYLRRGLSYRAWILIERLPDVGRSRRLMQRTSVDLPAPEMPMMPYTSPSGISRDTSSRACSSPGAPGYVLMRC